MRKRIRLYKKCRNISNYDNFKQARNEVTRNLRKAKKDYTDSLVNKLNTSNLSSQDCWKMLKFFIKPLFLLCFMKIITLLIVMEKPISYIVIL